MKICEYTCSTLLQHALLLSILRVFRVQTIENLFVAVGDTATFTCKYNASIFTRQFVKRATKSTNIILTDGNKTNNQASGSPLSLRIFIINHEDNGTYTIQIMNVTSTDQGWYQFEPDIKQFALWIINPQTFPSATIPEGTTVNVSCISDYSRQNRRDIKWIKDNVYVTNFTTWMLFPNISRNDTGVYTCCIKDGNKTHKQNVTITVQYPPDLTISFKNGNLTCTASGSPKSLTYFYLEHASYFGEHIRYFNLSSTSLMQLKGFEDNGRYTCIASNSIRDRNGRVNMTMGKDIFLNAFPVLFPENTYEHRVSLGQSQQIVVNVYCHPPCQRIYWMIENRTIETLQNKYYVDEKNSQTTTTFHDVKITVNVTKAWLLIRRIQETDLRQYTVTAVNKFGESFVKIKLRAKDKALPVVVWYIVSCLCGTTAICMCRFVYVCCTKDKI